MEALNLDLFKKLLNQYRSQILESTKYVNFRGIPLPKNREGMPIPLDIPLDKVYVQLQAFELKISPPEKSEKSLDGNQVVEEFSNQQINSNPKQILSEQINPILLAERYDRFFIIGGPGSGKSTILRYLARVKATHPNNPIPILIKLGEYASALSQDRTLSLIEFALIMSSQVNTEIRSALEFQIRAKNIIWLLDGLDETQNYAGIVSRQIQQLSGKLILTSRPVRYSIDELLDIPRFEIAPIADEKVDKFIRDWFLLISNIRQKDLYWATERISWLQKQLENQSRIKEITANPLLLTFLIILAGEEPQKELPSHRTELYRRYLEDLLESWEINRQSILNGDLRIGALSGDIAHKELLSGIYLFGWKLHLLYHGGKLDQMPIRDELINYLADYRANDWGINALKNSTEILNFWIQAGLLEAWYYKDKEFISFRHFTFQEFAASWVLAMMWNQNPKKTWKFLNIRLHNPAWREPILMMSTMLSQQSFELLAKYLLRGRSQYDNLIFRDIRLLGVLLVERKFASIEINNKVLDSTLRKIKNLLSKPFVYFEEISAILEKLSPESDNALLDVLNTKYVAVFEFILCAIARLHKDKVIPLLVRSHELIYDKNNFPQDEGIVNAIILAMGETRDQKAIPYLMEWHGHNAEIIANAIYGLGKIGDPSTLPYLLMNATMGWRRAEPAIMALSEFDPSIVIPFLESASKEEFGNSIERTLNLIRFKQDIKQLRITISEDSGQDKLSVAANNLLSRLFIEYDGNFVEQHIREEMYNMLFSLPLKYTMPHIENYLKSDTADKYLILDLLIGLHSLDSIDLLETLSVSKNDLISEKANILLESIRDPTRLNGRPKILEELLNSPVSLQSVEKITELGIFDDPKIDDYMIKALTIKLPLTVPGSLIRDHAYKFLSKSGASQALPKVLELIQRDEIDWVTQSDGGGIIGFVNKLSSIHEIKKVLSLLINKYSKYAFMISLKDFMYNMLTSFRLIKSYPNLRITQSELRELKFKNKAWMRMPYEQISGVFILEDIIQRLEFLEMRSTLVDDPLNQVKSLKNQNKIKRRFIIAIISTIATIVSAFLPEFFAISLPLVLRVILAFSVGAIVFIPAYLSQSSQD